MSNSPLVDYVCISPNKNSPRKYPITKITIHHMAGNLSVETCGSIFAKSSRQASSNYGIGTDGRVGMYVEEKDRSWCSSNADNDHRAITIEVANDVVGMDWHVSDTAYNKLIDLCVDICKRNGIDRLNYTGDKTGNLTMHKWFAATACPGPYLESCFPAIASEVNDRLNSEEKIQNGLTSADLEGMSREEAIPLVGNLCREDYKKTGILASVTLAQFILESNYGSSELARNANNFFGMKKDLSGNTWSGSTWDGSVYTKSTSEWNGTEYITIVSEFRKYPDIASSIADHSAYILGAMIGSNPRYEGISTERDYRKAFEILKNGGYATSPTYVDSLCSIVEQWNLTQFDDVSEDEVVTTYKVLPDCPFLVTVIVDDLNYRDQPSMQGAVKGQTGKGIFTITEVSNGWGKLKSGVGWIYLLNSSYCDVPFVETSQEEPKTDDSSLVWESNGPWRIESATGSDKAELKALCEKYGLKVSLI